MKEVKITRIKQNKRFFLSFLSEMKFGILSVASLTMVRTLFSSYKKNISGLQKTYNVRLTQNPGPRLLGMVE